MDSLKRAIADDRVSIEVKEITRPSPPSPVSGPFYEAMIQVGEMVWPGSRTLPYMSTGATDSAALRSAGIKTYGFVPLPHNESDWKRMHGNDERIRVKSLGEGVRFIYELVLAVASK